MRARTWAMLGGLLLGVAVARQVSRGRRRSHGANLFHAQPPMRHQALSWLDRHPSRKAVALLEDYVTWEQIPMLQRRGTTVLERMMRMLGRGDAA